MHWSHRIGSKGDAVIMGRMNIVKSVKGSFHVANRRFVAIGGKKGVNGREIWTGGTGKPTDTTYETLVGGRTSKLSGRIVVISGWSDGVNGHTGTVRRGSRGRIAGVSKEAFNKIGSKTRLIEMDPNGGRHDSPREMNSKEPLNNTHEIDFASLSQQTAEQSFDGRIFGKVHEVVNVETEGEGRS
jgi:hypothetical protein